MEKFFCTEIYFSSPDSRPVLFAPIPSRHLGGGERRGGGGGGCGGGRARAEMRYGRSGGAQPVTFHKGATSKYYFSVTLIRVEMIVQGAFAKGLFSFAYERIMNLLS